MNEYIDIFLSLATLTLLEVILGIDNLIFIAIVSQRLPEKQQAKARKIGLSLAWITRLLLLAFAVYIIKLTQPLLTFFSLSLSGRDIFLITGGIFLLIKAIQEIQQEIKSLSEKKVIKKKTNQFLLIVSQIAILDIVFSLDSVLTAIGLTQHFWLMATAITLAIFAMLFISESLSRFINRNPTIKMLALSFLILIGIILIADGFHNHVPRGYIYFALIFSLFIEGLNMIKRRKDLNRSIKN